MNYHEFCEKQSAIIKKLEAKGEDDAVASMRYMLVLIKTLHINLQETKKRLKKLQDES